MKAPPSDVSADLGTIRHAWPDRLFHWCMAVAVFVLLFSSLLPVVGVKFDWVPWHWVAGVCLSGLLLLHIIRAVFVQGVGTMWPSLHDFQAIFRSAHERQTQAKEDRAIDGPSADTVAKYDIYQKMYHWSVAVVVMALNFTGLLMLAKLDTPLWDRNPGLLTDLQWGYIYVAHGLTTLMLIFFVIVHVYFAILPEHRRLLRAMLVGTQTSSDKDAPARFEGQRQ